MPTYSYLNLGDDIPAASIFPIVVTPPDWAESIKQYQMNSTLSVNPFED